MTDADVKENLKEAIPFLEDAEDLLDQAVQALEDAEKLVPGSAGARIGQVRANVEIAKGGDHGWIGGVMFTLAESLQEVQDLIDGEDEDEDEDEDE